MLSVGRYQLLETLGEGGMGVVYKAFDPLIQRTIAVKLISARLDESPELRQRFFSEARAAGQLAHRNIVTIFDLGEDSGHPYFAMEFLQGRNLRVRMQSPELMSLDRKLEVMTQVCEGLAYAHSKGITHRDIKPANIFITDAGHVKVLDFGLARLPASELTHSKTLIGTLNYMAPEQISGERTDLRTDIFAVGVVFYELLASRSPFEADSVASLLNKILHELPQPVATLQPGIPPRLNAIVERALAKAREERYQNLGELLVDLAECRAELRGSDPGSGSRSAVPLAEWNSPPPVGATPVPRTPVPIIPPPGIPVPAARASDAPVPGTPVPGSGVSASAPSPGSVPSGPATAPGPLSRPPLPARRRIPAAITIIASLLVGGGLALALSMWWHGPTPGSHSTTVLSTASAQPRTGPAPPATDLPPRTSPSSRDAPSTRPEPGEDRPPVRSPEAHAPPTPVPTTGERGPRRAEGGANGGTGKSGVSGRREAEAGVEALGAAKRRADDLSASQLAPVPYRAASDSYESATSLMARGEFSQATAKLYEASGLFHRAEIEARTEQARRVEQERLAEAARSAEAARTAEGARSAERAPLPPPPPAAVEDAPRETGPSPASLEAGVRELLARYVAALESRNLASLKAIWPGLSGSQEAAIRAEFENARSIAVRLQEPAIQLSGSSATVACRREYEIETLDGRRLRSDTVSRLALRRQGTDWVIEGVRYDVGR